MFTSFFKVAIRIFVRDIYYTLVNIFGLAIGLAFSIIIFLYCNKELSFDRFHKNANRIYRIGIAGKVADDSFNHAVTPAPLYSALLNEVTGVENAVRVGRFGAWLVRYGNARYNEDNIIFSDSSFFNIFSFPLITGSPDEVLRKPKSIVLSRSTAQRYFEQENPVGKMLRIENDSTYYTVTGVMQDVPVNSHMHFDMVASLSTLEKHLHKDRWIYNHLYTYFLAENGISIDRIKPDIDRLVDRYVIPEYHDMINFKEGEPENASNHFSFVVQPLTDIHLKSRFTNEFEPVGKILYIHLFAILAVAILILSCVNFVSLVTARSASRAKEVGIRKVAGSEKKVLVNQFLLESSILAIFSMALALLITELILPSFNRYIGLDLAISQLLGTSGILMLLLLILVIGVLSGLYPAFYLSSFSPLSVLRQRNLQSGGNNHFRTALVAFQLFIAVGVITLTFIISGQFRYLVNKNLRFDKNNLLVIRRPDGLKDQLASYKSLIIKHSGVVSVTNTTQIPGGGFSWIPFYAEGNPATDHVATAALMVSYGFDSTFRVRLINGRFFNPDIPGDSTACVINETAASMLGLDQPVGKKIIPLVDNSEKEMAFTIIGVTEDFNFETLAYPIRPLVMLLMPGNFEGYLTVRLKPGEPAETIAFLQKKWEDFTSAYPFVSFFLDSELQKNYIPIRETSRIFAILSLVAILIASLGLFSLATYNIGVRKQEISIRKALGANALRIILYEMGNMLILILLSSILAWIGVFFLARAWFTDYANHISINPFYFLSATVLVIIISLVAICYQAYKAANENPVLALKYE
jgi:putative ABC transport system permease protein